LKDAEQAALNTLADHRAALDSLAKALVERETVGRSEVDAIVSQAEGSGHPNPLANSADPKSGELFDETSPDGIQRY
jgi:hypothetical protein